MGDIDILTDSDTDSDNDFVIQRTVPTEESLKLSISKRKRDIRDSESRLRRFRTQRDALTSMISTEERTKEELKKTLEQQEGRLGRLQDEKSRETAKEELVKGDAWRLVGDCVCEEKLLSGAGSEDFGVVSYSCSCTRRRMMHFKCVLSVSGSRCPWCREPMMFGSSNGKKRMRNSENGGYFNLTNA